MNLYQRSIIAWAANRINYLDSIEEFENSYAVSQEFCEWTTLLNVFPEAIKKSTLYVPDFNKGNRTSQSTQM